MPRLKRILKTLGIGLATLIALLLILNAVYSWHTGRLLEQRLAKLRAAGMPTTFAELAPQPIPAEQDAALQLQRLAPRLKAFAKKEYEFLDQTPLGKSFSERDAEGQAPTEHQIVAIRQLLSHDPELPHAIDQASRCPGYASTLDYTVADSLVMEELISNPSDRRTPARLLRWKIVLLLAEGKQEEALEMGLVILRLARHYRSEPALVGGLVAWAMSDAAVDSLNRVLRAGPISAAGRKQLDQELALQDDPAGFQHVLETERAINLSLSRDLFSQVWWLPWHARGLEIDTIDFHQRLLPILSQPWNQARDAFRQINTGVFSYSTPVSGSLLALLEPALECAGVAFNRNTARLRCLRILNQLTAYAQAQGHEAAGLEELNLPATATLDPFSGQPLKLKSTDQGWVIYSVFKNDTDEGSDFQAQADWGLGPAGATR